MMVGAVPRARAGRCDPCDERGQVLVAALGFGVVVLALAAALVAIGGAIGAKGRLQRAADLAAVSAARGMSEAFPRLFVPALLPDGSPNPDHLSRAAYLVAARELGQRAALANGAPAGSVEVGFPDGDSHAPLQVEVEIEVALPPDPGAGEGGRAAAAEAVRATAELYPGAVAGGGAPAELASGGGYAGPLAYRQGKPMRPDVAVAFDRLSRAASAAGHGLLISSAFRSDAEQARLFAANPDPRWVAPPGRSLHRCGTELDLGPPSAYGWLAANAERFGFLRRYSWEAWHFGFVDGPEPCSAAGDSVAGTSAGRGGADRAAPGAGLPGFVPARYRAPLLAAAAREGVDAALLAAQLMVESNFNPHAVSVAGAQGIAQFMPATAAAYGLRDPFDPDAAIAAQARLMAELLAQFGSAPLALAAYNAGPGAVGACGCIPPYPETEAYVARILAMVAGAGAAPAPAQLAVRLVA